MQTVSHFLLPGKFCLYQHSVSWWVAESDKTLFKFPIEQLQLGSQQLNALSRSGERGATLTSFHQCFITYTAAENSTFILTHFQVHSLLQSSLVCFKSNHWITPVIDSQASPGFHSIFIKAYSGVQSEHHFYIVKNKLRKYRHHDALRHPLKYYLIANLNWIKFHQTEMNNPYILWI